MCLVTGCMGPTLPDEDLALGQAPRSLTTDNGSNLNGSNLNGSNLNGNDLSQFMVSVNYLPAWRAGAALDQVWLEGTTFKGVKASRYFSGADFQDAEFLGNLGNGSTVRLRISAISAAPSPNEDLNLYDVKFLDSAGVWQPACRDSTGSPVLAMPLQGTWDYRRGVPGGGAKTEDPARFTFACMGGALAKCVLWGYRPWATFNNVQLAAYHQACTRLVRADYCGDGTSYTQQGSRINLYDQLGIQQDTEDWAFEAEWDAGGARCIYPLNRSHAGIPCYDARADYFCGQDLSPSRGALLRNETPSLLGGTL
jgi:uncharacterized protein YjbI with pentapeptide repeats